MIVCAVCGTENGDRAKFCQECAAALTRPEAIGAETRKTVTVLFCDVTGSTALGEQLDPEATRSVMTGYFAAMSRVIESHGGTVEKFIGDAVMAVFGVPSVHEDDALRALRAAAGMREALAELNTDLEQRFGVRLAARIGVNTGEVVVGGDGSKGTVATGDAVNVGARLEQAAGPDEVLFGPQTYALVRDHVDAEPVGGLTLKGKSAPLAAWRLGGVAAAESATRPVRLTSPLVGRGRELALMEQTLARCRADRRPQLLTVLGAAGVGKSRLVAAFLAGAAAGMPVLSGRCLSYGEDIAFYPLLEMLQGLAGMTPGEDAEASRRRLRDLVADDPDADRVVERLAPLAGLPGTPAAVEETHWAVRRLVERVGHESPVLVVLDDAHWAQNAMLELVEHLADWTRDTPCLVICLARPELLDDRPTWGGGKLNAVTVLLEPLPGDDADTLLSNLLGDAVLDADTRGRILDSAGGMPLFVEQMLAMLVDDGLVGGAAAQRPVSVDVPPTITALLAARLDRLPEDERAALEAASVIGTTFYRDAVAELVSAPPAQVGQLLMSLARKELVRPHDADLPGEEGFRFLHALVREAAYGGVSKARRSELHERFARWLTKRGEATELDVAEFVGHHLEQAVRLRRSLGGSSGADRELAREAARYLVTAAHRIKQADPASAASLYDRAGDLQPGGSDERLDCLRWAGDAWSESGFFAPALDRFERACEEARAAGADRQAVLADLAGGTVRAHVDAERDATRLPRLQQALAGFRDAGDDEGMLVAGEAVLELLNEAGQCAARVPLAEELRPVAERNGDPRQVDFVIAAKGQALGFGPFPLSLTLAWIDENAGRGGRLTEVGRTFARANCLAMLDRVDEARAELARGDALVDDLALPAATAAPSQSGGEACRHLGDLERADFYLRRGVDALRAAGELSYLSTVVSELGEVSLLRGDVAEARTMARLGQEVTPSSDRLSQALWRALAARVKAHEGDLETAQQLADEAVRWISETDMSHSAEVLMARAEVLRAAGRRHDARRDLQAALRTYELKGDRPCIRRTSRLLADLGA